MERYLKTYICDDLPSKIIILMGPRQCGKATLPDGLQVRELVPWLIGFELELEST